MKSNVELVNDMDVETGSNLINGRNDKPNIGLKGLLFCFAFVLFVALSVYLFVINLGLKKQIEQISSSVNKFETRDQTLATKSKYDMDFISMKIDPYRSEVKEGVDIVTFKLTRLTGNNLSKVVYWTDGGGACKSKTHDFSEFIDVPMDEIDDYVFFKLVDENGNESEIYASSPNPIFQCGKLAE